MLYGNDSSRSWSACFQAGSTFSSGTIAILKVGGHCYSFSCFLSNTENTVCYSYSFIVVNSSSGKTPARVIVTSCADLVSWEWKLQWKFIISLSFFSTSSVPSVFSLSQVKPQHLLLRHMWFHAPATFLIVASPDGRHFEDLIFNSSWNPPCAMTAAKMVFSLSLQEQI